MVRDPSTAIDGGRAGGEALVSVIIPCFNGERTLARTLESVLEQRHANFEALIVDDGSTDSTRDIAAAFAARDPRLRLIDQPNFGVAAARNAGIAAARGAFLAPLDADDIWAPDKLAMQLGRFQELGANVGVVYCWFDYVDEDDGVFSGGFRFSFEGDVLEHLCEVDFVGNGSNAMMRTALVREVGGYDSSLRARQAEGCEDWKLSLLLAERTRFAVVERPLVGYRILAGSMSRRTLASTRSAMLVSDEFAERRPEYAMKLRRHQLDREIYRLANSVRRLRWRDASVLGLQIQRFRKRDILAALWRFAKSAAVRIRRRVIQLVGLRPRPVRRRFPDALTPSHPWLPITPEGASSTDARGAIARTRTTK